MDRTRRRVAAAMPACALLSALPSPAARAQPAAFPSKPMTIVVPATPGGILDLSSRLIAGELSKRVGQPVTVDNRAGGGQVIGMQAMLRAEPDGHTMVMGSIGPNAANYAIFPKLPYAPGDFAPVAHVVSMPNVLLVHPSVPANTVAELVALAKAKPGGLSIASSGTATSSHLAGEMLKMRAGIDLVHVPYKGAAPALTDLVGGQVNVMVDNLVTALPHVNAGRLRALAVTTAQRAAELPDVPTVAESGYPGFEVTVWVGLLSASKVPAPLVERLHAEVAQVLAMPDVKRRLAEMGGASLPMSPAQFGAFIAAETQKWGAVVRQAGIKAE
ncbi:MAG: tripartite tricarboxylate transporter substrate binding protein [Burkholderiaceae bacterium]|jgi:tripartite-type tricarboxylate transporter receptor subunit TctC|nr:tripartite tricarboxylate transporter substrate binding protein [Burkholderiales bacterium]MCZ8341374.1 tripartite tricarboxylate transporter substrate binding protein [Burkholderiaceae bacterium]